MDRLLPAPRPTPPCGVVVVEREVAGFGASGRNGGWCSALFPPPGRRSLGRPAARRRGGPAARLVRHRRRGRCHSPRRRASTVHWAKGGTTSSRAPPVQLERARAEVEEARAWGFGERALPLPVATEARAVVGATDVLGGDVHAARAAHPPRAPGPGPRAGGRAPGGTIHERAIRNGQGGGAASQPRSERARRLGIAGRGGPSTSSRSSPTRRTRSMSAQR